MKNKKWLCAFVAGILCVPTLFALRTQTAEAGILQVPIVQSIHVADGELNPGYFEPVKDGYDIGAVGSEIVFGTDDAKTGDTATLNLNTKAILMDGAKDFLNVSATVTLESIPENARFAFSFGLPKRNSKLGTEGSIEVAFINDGGYKVGVYKNTAEGVTVLQEPVAITVPELTRKVVLVFSITKDGALTCTVDSTKVCETLTLGEAPEGYLALGYIGGECKTRVSGLTAVAYDYDAPENVELTGDTVETFSNGEYNANVWYSEGKSGAFTPSYVHVENRSEEDKDGVLRFCNSGLSHLTSRFQYSNFDLQFQLMDVGAPEYDEEGNLVQSASSAFEMVLGVTNVKEDVGTIGSAARFRIRCGGFVRVSDYSKVSNELHFMRGNQLLREGKMPEDCNPYDPVLTAGRRTDIRVKMVDGLLQMWMKYEDAEWSETPAIEYDFGSTPSGHLRMCSYGSGTVSVDGLTKTSSANFAIDNISLLNLDNENVKETTTVDFKTNLYEFGEDYKYVDPDDNKDLLSNRLQGVTRTETEEEGCSSALSALGALPMLGVVAFVLWRKRK